MFKKKIAIALTLLCAATMQTSAQSLVLTTPQDYEIYDISPNGKWACGGYSDYSYNYYGFRWNLETNETELLSTSEESLAWSIADDGTVAGTFQDREVLESGNPVEMAGYYKDGAWHHLEVPEGGTSGQGYGISTDGHYMVGEVNINGVYTTVIWKDGKIYKNFYDGLDAIPWCISPDGQMAAGWGYPTASGNRCNALWKVSDGSKTWLNNIEHFACGAKNFSPDGKKIVFWGGYKSYDENDDPLVAAVYDVATGEISYLPTPGEQGIYLYDITNSGMVLGEVEQSGGGYIWKDGQHIEANDFLDSYGVSLDNIAMYRDSVTNKPFILRAASASEDESRIGFIYYDNEGAPCSMVVFLDVQNGQMAPVEVAAKQMQDIKAVSVTWKKSVLGDEPDGYNIYRDGTKLNSTPLTATKYYDNVAAAGDYSYVVSAVYGSDEKKADAVSVTVAEKGISAPQALYARQKGVNGARLQWAAPASNYICRTYYDADAAYLGGFGTGGTTVSFEAAIKFDQEEMALYSGNLLQQVQFYPMDSTATGWKVVVYTRDAAGSLKSLYTQEITQTLTYNTVNTVKLDTPVSIPDGELIVGIGVTGNTNGIIGIDYGQATGGYSDLVRQTTESDFYSMKAASGGGYLLNWYINALFATPGTASNKDELTHYTVYADGQSQGTTQSLEHLYPSLSDGQHTLGVSATFADGSTSAIKTTDVTIAAKGVEDLAAKINGSTAVDLTWTAPSNDDNTYLSYARGAAKTGPTGPSDNNYGLMAGVLFDNDKLKGYDGYTVKSVNFYPTADALFTLYVLKDGVQVYEQEIEDYTLGQWNTVELTTPLTISEKSEYQLVIDCYDVTPNEAPLAVDGNSAYNFYSDLYSLDGESWSSLSDTGMNANWMIGWNLFDAAASAAAIDGYDVIVDGEKVASKQANTKYIHDFGVVDNIEHSAQVNVYYKTVSESVKGNTIYFTLKALADGIGAATVEKLNLHMGENILTIDGGANTIEAYSTNGSKVATVNGDQLNITGFAPGVYVIKAQTSRGTLTRTVEISK